MRISIIDIIIDIACIMTMIVISISFIGIIIVISSAIIIINY